jgi:hypothetical protein
MQFSVMLRRFGTLDLLTHQGELFVSSSHADISVAITPLLVILVATLAVLRERDWALCALRVICTSAL